MVVIRRLTFDGIHQDFVREILQVGKIPKTQCQSIAEQVASELKSSKRTAQLSTHADAGRHRIS
jgi:hypothetical protein